MADNWDDDDTPPPLGSLTDQVHAVQLSTSFAGATGLKDGELRTASTTHSQQQQAASAASKPLRKGFLDASTQHKHCTTSRSLVSKGSRQQDSMPVITAQVCKQPGVKQVPDFMRLQPTEEQKRIEAYKAHLVSALQPTPETVAAVNKDSTLMSGFDDPDIMAAVSEIARDPSAFKKHVNNPKVIRFYQAMGSLMGHKLENLRQQTPDSQQRWQHLQQQNQQQPFLP